MNRYTKVLELQARIIEIGGLRRKLIEIEKDRLNTKSNWHLFNAGSPYADLAKGLTRRATQLVDELTIHFLNEFAVDESEAALKVVHRLFSGKLELDLTSVEVLRSLPEGAVMVAVLRNVLLKSGCSIDTAQWTSHAESAERMRPMIMQKAHRCDHCGQPLPARA